MLGLAIDSANEVASAAIWTGDIEAHDGSFSLLRIETLPPEVGKADQLITLVERMLGERKLDYRDLDVIAVNRGPGSFTGIRSAVALARGLALAADLPVLAVTSHEALMATLDDDPTGRPSMIAQDARRGEVYAQTFGADGRPRGEIEALAPAALADHLLTGGWRLAGSGAGLVVAALDDGADVEVIGSTALDAGAVALAAAKRLARGEMPVRGFELRPLYVRAPDAVPPAPLVSKVVARGGSALTCSP
ncbi:MAG: tRNA (adenosine(37)-N6)-threonylcarbamoyltransferase complex dimerization subunit type 1 TsaB [Geminicoccaceae bacterium]